MVLRLIVACFFVASTIFFAEVARANRWVSGERARKIIHILIGIWGAWLPIWLGWRSIIVLGIILFLGVAISHHFRWFKSIHSVSRSTVGEYLFPVTMIILALFFKNDIIFAAAMLQMGIADGLAAVIGTRYGKNTRFKILGQNKSWHGTVTFFVCSTLISLWAISALHQDIAFYGLVSSIITIIIASIFGLVLTIAELTSTNGLDNLSVTLLTAIGLSLIC